MKKYLLQQGYKFKGDYNDMTDKQFSLVSTEYNSSENSTLSNLVLDMSVTYMLFLKSFEPGVFRATLEEIVNSANADGLCAALDNSISVEIQENGYMITMNFSIKG